MALRLDFTDPDNDRPEAYPQNERGLTLEAHRNFVPQRRWSPNAEINSVIQCLLRRTLIQKGPRTLPELLEAVWKEKGVDSRLKDLSRAELDRLARNVKNQMARGGVLLPSGSGKIPQYLFHPLIRENPNF